MNRMTVGIIGFGRFGQFWAKTISGRHAVIVHDRNPEVQDVALKIGVKFAELSELCAKSNTIFICIPINQFDATVKSIKPYIKSPITIFDVCSVKVHPASVLQKNFSADNDIELIATHPMFGPDSGASGLTDLPMVMWPLSPNKAQYDEWKLYFSELGLSIVEMTPDKHDLLAANSQGITHYIGRVLNEMHLSETPIDTEGFRILQSVIKQTCNDTWELFNDLQYYNPHTRDMRVKLGKTLDCIFSKLIPERVSPDEFVIGIQGGKGSFNEEACRDFCSRHSDKIPAYRIEPLYKSDMVLSELHEGKIDRGFFAIQNSKGGVVMETIKALSQYNCEILDVFDIVISHCILHHPSISFDKIDTIISHPQALKQCANNLKKDYNNIVLEEGKGNRIDQSLCAKYIGEGKIPPTTAVLGPKVCAKLYNLTIHQTDLQDLGKNNITTFALIQRRQ